MEQLVIGIAAALGMDHELMLSLIPMLVLVAQFVGKSIPDTATGPLGVLRRIAKIVGLYRSNKIAPKTSVADVAARTLGIDR